MIDGNVSGTQPSRPEKHIVNVGLPALQCLRSLMHAHMGLEGCGQWSGCVLDGDVSGTELSRLEKYIVNVGRPVLQFFIHSCMHIWSWKVAGSRRDVWSMVMSRGRNPLDLRSILLTSGFSRCNFYVHSCMLIWNILARKGMIIVSLCIRRVSRVAKSSFSFTFELDGAKTEPIRKTSAAQQLDPHGSAI